MIINLGTITRAEVIASVLGQLSDGIWENSSAMDKYWMFADVDGTNLVIDDEPFIDERSWGRYGRRIQNGFAGKSAKQIKDWFANKAKQVVKIWAEDYNKDPNAIWDRNNTDEVTYMGHSSRVPDVTVADVYECYDFLKDRYGKKYGITEETALVEVEEEVGPKVSGGMDPSQQEVEDFFLDASTQINCSKKGTKYPSYIKASSVGGISWDSIWQELKGAEMTISNFVQSSSSDIVWDTYAKAHNDNDASKVRQMLEASKQLRKAVNDALNIYNRQIQGINRGLYTEIGYSIGEQEQFNKLKD